MENRTSVRSSLLSLFKFAGLFALAGWITRRHLRILCYHGAELIDESAFKPGLFIGKETFRRRMKLVQESRYRVRPLGEAVEALVSGNLEAHTVVITIDDGWFGTYELMAPVLKEFGFPATLYVSTYYMEKQTQVFNVAVDYAIWKAGARTLALQDVDESLSGSFDLDQGGDRRRAANAIVSFAEQGRTADDRQAILIRLCDVLDVDSRPIVDKRLMAFMTRDEAKQLAESNIDIQLHTHRHCFPDDSFESTEREIEDNRRSIAGIETSELEHFCYPSGEYTQKQIPWLESLGVTSATTTEIGINSRHQSRFELRRILDSEDLSDVEIEAELSGFAYLLRRLIGKRSD